MKNSKIDLKLIDMCLKGQYISGRDITKPHTFLSDFDILMNFCINDNFDYEFNFLHTLGKITIAYDTEDEEEKKIIKNLFKFLEKGQNKNIFDYRKYLKEKINDILDVNMPCDMKELNNYKTINISEVTTNNEFTNTYNIQRTPDKFIKMHQSFLLNNKNEIVLFPEKDEKVTVHHYCHLFHPHDILSKEILKDKKSHVKVLLDEDELLMLKRNKESGLYNLLLNNNKNPELKIFLENLLINESLKIEEDNKVDINRKKI